MNPLEIGTWLNYVYKRGYIDLTRLKKIPMCTMNPAYNSTGVCVYISTLYNKCQRGRSTRAL